MSRTSGGRLAARRAAQVADDAAAVERRLDPLGAGSSSSCAGAIAATARSAAARLRSASTTQTNLAKW